MERYELIEGSAAKFWEVSVEGVTLTVRYGRIGTKGQTKDKDYASAAAATKEKDKLVREKTGKGYARVGSGETAIAPAAPAAKPTKADASAPPVEAASAAHSPGPASPGTPPAEAEKPAPATAPPSTELDAYLTRALPTRTRPQGALDGTAAWTALRELLLPTAELGGIAPLSPSDAYFNSYKSDEIRDRLAKLEQPQKDAASWVRTRLSSPAPESVNADEAHLFAENVENVADQLVRNNPRWPTNAHHSYWAPRVTCMTPLMCWLVTRATPEIVIQLATTILQALDGEYAWQHSPAWSSTPALALRLALVRTPEAYYEELIRLATKVCAEKTNWKLTAHFAFILADDRPQRHQLQALAVLNAAEAAGEEKTNPFIPLILDAPPAGSAHWRLRRDGYFGDSWLKFIDIAATAVAAARHYQEPALPMLDWLLYYAKENDKTELARLILALDEDGALNTLLPQLHDKWIRAALDAAAKANPGRTFRQCLSAVAAGRTEPQLKTRVMEVITRESPATLRQWAAGSDAKAQSYLQRALEAAPVQLAAPDSWPDVLRDPPWRKRARASEDIVLELIPITTPFSYTPGQESRPYHYRSWGRVVPSMADLPAAITQYEANRRTDITWHAMVPPPSIQPPQPGAPEDGVLKWLSQRLEEVCRVRFGMSDIGYQSLVDGIERQPESLSLMLWQSPDAVLYSHYSWRDFFPGMMARFGEQALPGLLRQIELAPILVLENVLGIEAGDIAPHAARALFRLRKARVPAMAWLRRYPTTAILRLIPDAVGPGGEARDAAEHALRWFVTDTDKSRADIESLAQDYAGNEPRVAQALAQVLGRDPLGRYPAKIARLPTWFVPGALSRPELVSGGALPDEAVTALAEMLSFSTPDAVYAGIAVVREQTTKPSLAAFAWDLFSAWLANGAPSKDGWAMRAVGWCGDDECARRLTQLIRKWPGEAAHARAVTGLDVLVDIGSDIALMNLNGIAEKLKFKGLQEKAREKIAALAEARDLTPEELSDRLAPDLDLDERGGLDLDFGERRFRAGFDEFLKPWVKDSTGQRLKDLPKPNKSDDPEISTQAVERWKALKKDARAIASLQITRLENMLSTSRRTQPDVFWTFFASHPLIRHLAQRLVWGVYADDSPRSAPTVTFRVTDDLSITDVNDEALELDVSKSASGRIGLVHPLQPGPGGMEAWGALFGDYEIAQPFPQLAREIFELTEAEKGASEILRFDGHKVEAARIRGMPSRGWQLGEPQDGGAILWIERKLRLEDGTVETVMLDFSDGHILPGSPEYDEAPTLNKVTFDRPYQRATSHARRFGELDPVTASEMLRGLHLLVTSQNK
ncbi:MAG: DUF4132 domain-containing protein [Alphaproteobacteria bacterium]|nr:DUF4132 domain-containing protein [Alphaproteobacteria bacterium]